MLVLFSRLLGTATVPLKDLVKDSSHTMQADVNLLDANNRMTEVSESVDMSTDISVEHWSMCRLTGDQSVGRDVDRHIGRGVCKLHMIRDGCPCREGHSNIQEGKASQTIPQV